MLWADPGIINCITLIGWIIPKQNPKTCVWKKKLHGSRVRSSNHYRIHGGSLQPCGCREASDLWNEDVPSVKLFKWKDKLWGLSKHRTNQKHACRTVGLRGYRVGEESIGMAWPEEDTTPRERVLVWKALQWNIVNGIGKWYLWDIFVLFFLVM